MDSVTQYSKALPKVSEMGNLDADFNDVNFIFSGFFFSQQRRGENARKTL